MYEFTKRAEISLECAKDLAVKLNSKYIGTEYLLYGLVAEGKGIACSALQAQNITCEILEEKINELGFTKNTKKKIVPELTPRAKKILENSVNECKKMSNNYIGTEHILLSVIKEVDSIAVKLLIDLNVEPSKLMLDLVKIVSDGIEVTKALNETEEELLEELPNLSNYSKNLTLLAKQGKLDKLYERDDELQRLIDVLLRKTKNNPLILGEAGVGKTALVEGLAYSLAKEGIQPKLEKHQIIQLDISSMVAGAKYRGDFEERLKSTIKEVKSNSKIILFIDEIHSIVGAGSAEGAIDAAAILKPILARNEITLIGATTFDEYRRHIEKDSALSRRFQTVILEEPDYEKSVKILKGVKPKYEKYHGVKISVGSIYNAVKLSERYITQKRLPDKALDVLDEACIAAKSKSRDKKNITVKSQDICTVISNMLKIPISKISQSESEKYSFLADRLKKKIIGQDKAIDIICKAVLRGRVGLKDPKRPVGSFLLLGPTGVGKTEIVKQLAQELFDSEKNLVRLDMSEYSEQHSVAKLIGAPPGYIGYEQGGKLTEEVKKKPYCVVLFDEIEKAHSDIYNLLLQIMDDGILTDSNGKTIDFKNTICVMTSNVGAKKSIERTKMGFGGEVDYVEQQKLINEEINKEVKKTFSPEFLNRLDEIVIFNRLSKENIKEICYLMLEEEKRKIEGCGAKLIFSEEVVNKIAIDAYHSEYGARPMRREIQKKITNQIAEILISKQKLKKKEIVVTLENNEIMVK